MKGSMATANATKQEKVRNGPNTMTLDVVTGLSTDKASPVLCVPSLQVQQLVPWK